MTIEKIVYAQRQYFLNEIKCEKTNSKRLSIKQIKNNLHMLKKSILENYDLLIEAFRVDYNKREFDVCSTEVGLVLNEIKYMIKHLNALTKKKRVATSIINFPSAGFKVSEPYGVVLIVAPWNYPFQLSMMPLVGALAGGNTVVLKPSNYCPEVSKVIKKILSVFDEKYVSVVLGGREQNQQLFEQKFDFIFFTGGTQVAKVLYEKASKNLTPCVFELGGKSPCIVDEDAKVDLSAKRIVWGKFLNAGQTCVAPDYVYVHESVKEQFLESVKKYINKFYYEGEKLTENFPYIINSKHVERLKGLINTDKLVVGGKVVDRCLEPTVLNDVTWDDAVMQEEIFGPIMPVLTFNNLDDVLAEVKSHEKPLALYYFGGKKDTINKVVNEVSYGGGCMNDVIMHLTEEKLPFGGVGFSGMGSYHGKKSFETFTHEKSILSKSKLVDLPVRYMPSSKAKIAFVKWIFGIKTNKNKTNENSENNSKN